MFMKSRASLIVNFIPAWLCRRLELMSRVTSLSYKRPFLFWSYF